MTTKPAETDAARRKRLAREAAAAERKAAEARAAAIEADGGPSAVEPTDPDDIRPTVEVRDREFHLREEVPAFTLLRLSASADPKTPVPAQMQAVYQFLLKIVVPEEVPAFVSYLEDTEPIIGFEELNEVMTKATEAVGNRPT